jgi:hypothetical protein
MAFSDYIGGQGWSGHKAPDGSQTNPDNDPLIAASQERLRQYASLTRDQLTNPRVVGQMTTGSGDDQGSQSIIQYDSPFGPVIQYGENGGFRTGEKFWWKPGLAEQMEIVFGEDGKIVEAKPRDSKYSFGEQLGDFAGNLVTMGASALAMYGAAYGLGSTVGTGVGTGAGGTTAGATAGEAGIIEMSAAGMEGAPIAAAPSGTSGAAGVEMSAAGMEGGAIGSTAPASAGGAPAATATGTGAPITTATPTSAGSGGAGGAGVGGGTFTNSSSYWGDLLNSRFGQQVGAGVISAVGSSITENSRYERNRGDQVADRELAREQALADRAQAREETLADRAAREAREDRLLEEARAYRTRNLTGPGMRMDWSAYQVPRREPWRPSMGPSTGVIDGAIQ